MIIDEFVAKVRRQETDFYRTVYTAGKAFQRFSVPAPKWIFGPVRTMHTLGKQSRTHISRILYYQPMFEAACESCGKNFSFSAAAMPLISGDVRIIVGDNCHFNGNGAILGYKIFEKPTLSFGNHTYVGFSTIFNVAKSIEVGSNVLISDSCIISDNPGHPLDPVARRENQPIHADQVRSVRIEDDAWICARSTILPGVTVGKGSVVGTGAIVTKDVPAYTVVAGNPAVVVKELNHREC